jgi:hypothetical protein
MWCNALRNITAEDIVDAAKKVVEEVKESK